MRKILLGLLIVFFTAYTFCCAQNTTLAPLTIEKIMRDPVQWLGTSPSDMNWSEDSRTVYFKWNPDKNKADSLYMISVTNPVPKKVAPAQRKVLPSFTGTYNRMKTEKVFERNGDIFWMDIKKGTLRQITQTVSKEDDPVFSFDERKILFTREDNLFAWHIADGSTIQLTNFKKGKPKAEDKKSDQDKWLNQDQLAFFEIVKERKAKKDSTEKYTKADKPKTPKEIYLDEKGVSSIRLSPDEKYITYRLSQTAKGVKTAVVPSYVTESGYTEELQARTKVGGAQASYEFFVYDIEKDTFLTVSPKQILGITDKPDYLKDYLQKATAKKDTSAKKEENRKVVFHGPYWSDDGKQAIVIIRAADNKDRWIMGLDVKNRTLKLLDRQRDEAWVAGPGINGGWTSPGELGWLGDNRTLWFQSEEGGYSHLYTIDVVSGKKQQLTKGKFEVSGVGLSKDKKHFYFVSNEVHPGEKHLYKIPVTGGKATQLTSGTGAYEPKLSPDEKYIALRYSYSTKPWELYLMENKAGAKLKQVTQSTTEEFRSYAWREPELVTFTARDGAQVYARLYKPANAKAGAPGVIFVHGAGYLQNAHKFWSQYFREYMFHNLLANNGYTVLDIDYRGSAGYGRDWRTGIYRHMGGKDLTDHIDGAKYLIEKQSVDAKRLGIYGGSYGGFITLMALFTQPDVFAAGAALRSVTDWAHYNQGYTSNILNEPHTDSLAYARSSPLYYAEGLKSHLLMCHGMLDVNVHFQDIVRLSQRLIELKKENWELAVYPMEDHAFTEASSWTDEYKRIFKLFEERVKGNIDSK